jgi:hypothetical protein
VCAEDLEAGDPDVHDLPELPAFLHHLDVARDPGMPSTVPTCLIFVVLLFVAAATPIVPSDVAP